MLLSTWCLQSVALVIGTLVLDFQEGTFDAQSIVTETNAELTLFTRSHNSACDVAAITTGSTVMLITMLLGGFYVRVMPVWLDWSRYLSIINYSYSVLMNIEFTSSTIFTCAPENSAYPSCATGSTFDGTEVIAAQGINTRVGLYVGVLLIVIVGLRLVAYLVLRFRKM